MRLTIEIPEQMYQNAKDDMLFGSEIIVNAIKNGIPQETITEFADRCKECGAKYGRLLKQEPKQGRWDKGYTFPDGDYWKCTNCKELIKVKYPMNYCNNCGSKNE